MAYREPSRITRMGGRLATEAVPHWGRRQRRPLLPASCPTPHGGRTWGGPV